MAADTIEPILYIVIPAYNEEECVERIVSDWYPVVERHDGGGESRLVIINDGSTDRTYEILGGLAKTRPLLRPLTKPNGGHGPTLIYGYRHAIEQGADYIFQTDSDGQTSPDEFESFWKRRTRYEAIFGKRSKRGDGLSRLAIERVLCGILTWVFGIRVPDANAPYRLMSSSYVGRYLDRMPEDYNLPNVMLVVFGEKERRRIRFLEITFRPRQGGKNSINMKKITAIGFRAVREFRQFEKSMNEEVNHDR